jgi:hypothetical protein
MSEGRTKRAEKWRELQQEAERGKGKEAAGEVAAESIQ